MKLKRFFSWRSADKPNYRIAARGDILGKDFYAGNRSKKTSFGWIKVIFFWFFLVVSAGALSYGAFFSYKIYRVGKKINIEPKKEDSYLSAMQSLVKGSEIRLKKSEEGRLNILLAGIAGKGKPGQYLTDTLMVVSVDMKTGKVAMLSIPRDLYVQIPENSRIYTKINSVYQYGLKSHPGEPALAVQTILDTVRNITSLPIDYYAILNFDGFEKIIDTVGGIHITNERDIYDPRYPGPHYSYETFELKKGFHLLDGATALKYARERHNDPEGDFGRAKRQQQILQAAKNKIFSAATFLDVFALNTLVDTLGENIQTNITPEEIGDFLELAKKSDTRNINTKVVDAWDKTSLLKVSHVFIGEKPVFALVPRVGNYSEIHDLARNIFDLNAITRAKESIAKENARIGIINTTGNANVLEQIQKVLRDNLDYQNVTKLKPANQKLLFRQNKSIVYDFTNGSKPFALNELATKLPGSVSYETSLISPMLPEQEKFDILIVIEEDLLEKYDRKEGSLEDLNKERDD